MTTGTQRHQAGRCLRWALLPVDGFVAATAVGGGAALAAGLEDDHLGLDLLSGTAFTSYLWPGVALARLVGGSATAATVLAARRHPAAGVASMAAGAVLAAWILSEIAVLHQPSEPTPTERLYLAAAAAMAGLGLFAVRRHGPVRSGPRNSRS